MLKIKKYAIFYIWHLWYKKAPYVNIRFVKHCGGREFQSHFLLKIAQLVWHGVSMHAILFFLFPWLILSLFVKNSIFSILSE